jgi:hypothetical protein
VFENSVLRRTFGPKRKEVAGEWRNLENEKLHNLYSSSNIIRVIQIKEGERSRSHNRYTYLLTHSVTHSLTHSLIHSLTHSIMQNII